MSAQLSVADVLERAADLIEPEGAWVQGYFSTKRDGVPCYCAVGAIIKFGEAETRTGALDVLHRLLDGGVFSWNDDPERTQAEVVAKLREAAAISRTSSDKYEGDLG